MPLEGLICTDGASGCAADLNAHYSGFDESDDQSSLGVPMRGRQSGFDAEGKWFFCTGQCWDSHGKGSAQPDCYTAAALVNHKMMVTKDGQLPSKSNSQSRDNAFFARYPVQVVLQPATALTRLTKCAWQFDGAAFNRLNGGCSSPSPEVLCNKSTSAFGDRCPGNESQWADETCDWTMKASCKYRTQNPSVDYRDNCFWTGPSWTSPVHPDAKPNFDYSQFEANDDIRSMMKNRVTHQDGRTDDGLPLREYWNEITMDGRIIQHFSDFHGVQSVVAAFAYVKGSGWAKGEAKKFQDWFKQKNDITIPLLALDTTWKAGSGPGPFTLDAASTMAV